MTFIIKYHEHTLFTSGDVEIRVVQADDRHTVLLTAGNPSVRFPMTWRLFKDDAEVRAVALRHKIIRSMGSTTTQIDLSEWEGLYD